MAYDLLLPDRIHSKKVPNRSSTSKDCARWHLLRKVAAIAQDYAFLNSALNHFLTRSVGMPTALGRSLEKKV